MKQVTEMMQSARKRMVRSDFLDLEAGASGGSSDERAEFMDAGSLDDFVNDEILYEEDDDDEELAERYALLGLRDADQQRLDVMCASERELGREARVEAAEGRRQ